jgi:choline-sulfatase
VTRQPNILFIMADQLAAGVLPFYGGPADAPNLARLAEQSVVFDHAYCVAPLCAPSRAALLSGRLSSATGTYDNGAEFAASIPTVAHHLRARGYATCLAGKMHFIGPDQLHGFEERLTTDVYTAGLDWIADWSLPLSERLPWYHDMSSVLDAGVSEATLQLDYDEEVAFQSVRKLYDFGRARDRPFFFLVSFTHPHDPYEIPARYWDPYEGRAIPEPAVPPLPLDEHDAHSRRVLEMCGTDAVEIDETLAARARRAYYAAVSYVDDKVGALLDAVAATGLADDTIIVFASDHGDMLGERGLWYKMTFFEDSARVPFFVYEPDRKTAARIEENVSLLDLLPTFVELAGETPVAPPDPRTGRSLVPLLHGDMLAPRPVIAEYLAEGARAPCVMIKDGELKYIHSPIDPELLYDLSADPLELTNLATSPEYEQRVVAFRRLVDELWDLEKLERAVLESQQRRLVVAAALSSGEQSPWDYGPPDRSSTRYVRGRNFWEPFGRARLRHD